jgi:hypothetical protein
LNDGTPPSRPTSYDKKVALVLHGGGVLGSHQAGVYDALVASDYLPDWVNNAGIQIVHPVESFPFVEWKKIFAVHLDGAKTNALTGQSLIVSHGWFVE